MNRDTLYSLGVFDVTSPLTVEKPDSGNRFMSMLVINQDHSMLPVEHGPGKFTFTKENIGTRYVFIIFRTFVNANSKEEIAAANALQDLIKVSQKDAGRFEIPDWDEASLKTVRDAILVLALTRTDTSPYFGKKEDLNPLYHLNCATRSLCFIICWERRPVGAAIPRKRQPTLLTCRNRTTARHPIVSR